MDNRHVERLHRIRSGKEHWQEVRYLERKTEENTEDANYPSRYGVLTALQYELHDDDHDLVCYLVEQECLHSENAPFQGLHDSLILACFLLSNFKRTADVWLFWRAKRANFDTYGGFDVEFMLSAGVGATKEYMLANQSPERMALLEYLKQHTAISESHLDSWRASMQKRFPRTECDEDLLSVVARDITLGEFNNAKTVLLEWERTQPRTKGILGLLAYYLILLKDFSGAVTVTEELLENVKGDHWETVSQRTRLAECLTQSGRHDDALKVLEDCEPDLTRIESWKRVGLGRSMIEAALDVGLHPSSSKQTAIAALLWADKHLNAGCSYSPNMLDKIVNLAKSVSNTGLEERYSSKKTRAS